MFHGTYKTSSGHQQIVEIPSTSEFNFPKNTTKVFVTACRNVKI